MSAGATRVSDPYREGVTETVSESRRLDEVAMHHQADDQHVVT
jgi:hypothetical protein